MAYTPLTTVANIESYFKAISFTASGSAVTGAEVDNWIAQATAVIYGALSSQYAIPITDADDLKQLESLADMFVLTNVKQVLNPNQLKMVKDDLLKIIQPDHIEFYKTLRKYDKSELKLPNSSYNPSLLKARSYNDDNNIEPIAKKYEDQW